MAKPLCTVLPQMSGYIKCFDNDGKNMSFKIENDNFLIRYNEIWNKLKKMLSIKFYSHSVYAQQYITIKVKHLMV